LKSLFLFVLLIASVPAAAACSCGGATIEEGFENADLVFVGTALDIAPPDVWLVPGWRLRTTTFEVEETFKSALRSWDAGRVTLAHSEDNCDAAFEPGVRYLVFAWWTDDQLARSGYCAPNEVLSPDSEAVARVRAVADTATFRPPLRDPSSQRTGEVEAEEGMEGRASWWSLGLNVVLGVALLLLLAHRRARASQPTPAGRPGGHSV
tara:strand:- start:77 stop:700 length:624 start_codon:yes stop_codon:yes gene_type:complete